MCNKRDKDGNDADLDTYLVEHLSGEEPLNVFPAFKELLKWLQNWNKAGTDKIFKKRSNSKINV
jgi:hypothetical protein